MSIIYEPQKNKNLSVHQPKTKFNKYHSKEILHFPASRSIYLTSIITKKEFQYCQYVAV